MRIYLILILVIWQFVWSSNALKPNYRFRRAAQRDGEWNWGPLVTPINKVTNKPTLVPVPQPQPLDKKPETPDVYFVHPGWRPKRPPGRPPPPPGYSGYRPTNWGSGSYAYDTKTGERELRVSQQKFEEYLRKIYGNNYTETNSILTPEELNGRKIAAPEQFRHMAAVGVNSDDDRVEWKCGGSLIDQFFVLTVAHCADFGGEPATHVLLGDINLRDSNDQNGVQKIKIQEVIIYPEYKKELYYHDIALLRLSTPAIFTRHVRPARLWSSSEIPYVLAFAMGYGATTFGRAPTDVLTFFNLTLIGNRQCNSTLSIIDETPQGILGSQICAMDLEGSTDTCQGDSGGPLQLHLPGRKRPRYFLIGITSYGTTCGSRTPSVYTRIYSYLDWIESIVWPTSENEENEFSEEKLEFN